MKTTQFTGFSVVLTGLLLLATGGWAQDTGAELEPSGVAPWGERFRFSGEELHYSIEILGSEAVRVAVAVSAPADHPEYGRVIPVEGVAVSVGFFGNVYPITDEGRTLLSAATGLPIESRKSLDEKGRVRVYDVNYGGPSYRTDIARTERSTQRTHRPMPSHTHDAFSWMLDLRTQDLSVGSAHVYYIFDGWKLSRLTARVEAHTDLVTANEVYRVAEMRFTRESLFTYAALPWAEDANLPPVFGLQGEAEDLGNGWFSLDERRLPIGVAIATPIGNIRMILSRHVPPSGPQLGN